MATAKLTAKQRHLVGEVRQILSTLRLDPDAITADEDVIGRTPRLELAKNQIIRSAVILKYVLMDEFLSGIICWHYFGKGRSFPQLWKTKRFRSFNYFVLERLPTFFRSWTSSRAFTTSRGRLSRISPR